VLVAEATLHVASANIGVATAAMLPGLRLNGSIGVNGNTISTLFSWSSLVWSIGAGLTAPIFHGGALWNQRKAAIAAYRQALASYRQTVLGAFGDVANALWAVQLDAELVVDEANALDAASQTRKLIEANYASGLVDYLQVLVAEDQYQQAKIGHIQAEAQRLQDTVALFVALGGGWWSVRASVCGT
jgi:outer membrane protein TolC